LGWTLAVDSNSFFAGIQIMNIRSFYQLLAVGLVPLLLVLVAARQIYLVQSQQLTPWLGGGFGMFASVDRIDHRVTRAYAISSAGEFPLILPRLDDRFRLEMKARVMPAVVTRPGYEPLWEFQVQEMKTRAMPTRDRLEKLALMLTQLSWDAHEIKPVQWLAKDFEPGSIEVTEVRVEVWRLAFEPSDKTVRAELLGEISLPVGDAKN